MGRGLLVNGLVVTLAVISLWHCETVRGGAIVGWGGRRIDSDPGKFAAVAAGSSHCLGLRADGTVYGWGDNWYGTATAPAGQFLAASGGYNHSVALRVDGSIAAWGRNNHGQLDVPDGNDFVAVAAGGYHNVALRSDGASIPAVKRRLRTGIILWRSLAAMSIRWR